MHLAGQEIHRDVQACHHGHDEETPVIAEREREGGQQHGEKSEQIRGPHRHAGIHGGFGGGPGPLVVARANRPAGQPAQPREIIESLGNPPDFHGGSHRDLYPEMPRSENVINTGGGKSQETESHELHEDHRRR